jgi:tRNA-specific 2-thiouridylase
LLAEEWTLRFPQKAITPGQFAAWYDGEELIGSGVIS